MWDWLGSLRQVPREEARESTNDLIGYPKLSRHHIWLLEDILEDYSHGGNM